MVLTEAFAAGTPVVASNIAGYSDVVTDGVDGVLVPPADPQRLAEELQSLSLQPRAPRRRWAEAARESAERYAWPRVAERVEGVYERRPARPGAGRRRRAGRAPRRPGAGRRRPPRRRRSGCPSLDPLPAAAGGRHRIARRIGLGVAGVLGVGLTFIAAQRIGVDNVVDEHRPLRRDLGAGRDRR